MKTNKNKGLEIMKKEKQMSTIHHTEKLPWEMLYLTTSYS